MVKNITFATLYTSSQVKDFWLKPLYMKVYAWSIPVIRLCVFINEKTCLNKSV